VTVEITDYREISKVADKKFSDIHEGTQRAVLTSDLPSVHYEPFNRLYEAS
jgi:hypothetical protein